MNSVSLIPRYFVRLSTGLSWACAAAFSLLLLTQVTCAQGVQNLLLVVNEDSADSLEIANHYIALRQIPPRNVVYLKSVHQTPKTGNETIGSAPYRTTIFEPLQRAIKNRKLETQIDIICFSTGFPTRIGCGREQKKYMAAKGIKYDIHYHAPFLSLTSACFFGESLFANQPYFLDQDANWYAAADDQSTLPFSATTGWDRQGNPAANGRRYRLVSILGVIRPGGSTVAQVKRQLSRSVGADGSQPQGIFYFAKTADPRSRTRQSQFAKAAEALEKLGHSVEVGAQAAPRGKTIVSAMLGSAKHDWQATGSKLVPGALCDNFTSYGAWWEKKQTHLTEFLNAGAAMSSGTVYEPYTMPIKLPTAFTFVHYATGLTAVEAMYRTVKDPFQLLIVGDPLCRPFAQPPQFTLEGIKHQSVVENDLKIKVIPAPSSGIQLISVFVDGIFQVRVQPEQWVQLAKADLGPGFHQLRFAAVDDSPVAATRTEVVDVFVRPSNSNADLKLTFDKDTVKLGGSIRVSCRFIDGQKVVLRHNGRVLGTFQSTDQPVVIKASQLGRGESKLYATAVQDGTTLSGVPKKVTIK